MAAILPGDTGGGGLSLWDLGGGAAELVEHRLVTVEGEGREVSEAGGQKPSTATVISHISINPANCPACRAVTALPPPGGRTRTCKTAGRDCGSADVQGSEPQDWRKAKLSQREGTENRWP